MSQASLKEETIFLELGQVIQINAPENVEFNEKIFIIDYLDEQKIELIKQDDLSSIILSIEDGNISDESIESIFILENPVEKGYAKQNDLIPGNWISIFFDGKDVPEIINGEITDIEEDMIEIRMYPNNEIIYIDFGYKGIPKELNISKIQLIEKPGTRIKDLEEDLQTLDDKSEKETKDEEELDEDEDDLDIELDLDTGEQKEHIQEAFIDLDDIVIVDEELEEITEDVQVSETEKRFSIEMQTSDLLDELLSAIPSNERNQETLNKIHISIERFKQLRNIFSNFNKEGNTENIKKKGANYKPLIESLNKFNKNLHWLIPVVKNKKNLYDKERVMEDEDDTNINLLPVDFAISKEFELIYQYNKNNIPDGENKYKYLYRNLNQYMTPFIEPSELTNIIINKEVNSDIEVITNNINDFYSTTMSSPIEIIKKTTPNIEQNRFILERATTGLSHLVNPDVGNKKSILFRDQLTPSDNIYLKGILTLPKQVIDYSKINLPMSSIYTKSNLNMVNYLHSEILKQSTNYTRQTITENNNDSEIEFNFDKINYFDFDEVRRYDDRQDDLEVYNKFLEKVVPKTKIIFRKYKKYLENVVSFNSLISKLEPFLIYKDDITYKQYVEMNSFIYQEIDKIKKKLIVNKSKYSKYLTEIKNYDSFTILPSLVGKNSEYTINMFSKEGYNIQQETHTDVSIKKIIDCDSGLYYNTALANEFLSLAQPIALDETIREEMDAIKLSNEMGDTKECQPITLAKKYNDIEEIERDSRDESQIFFDTKYDDTPYDIGRSWLEENSIQLSDKNPEEIVFMLSEFLKINNGLTEENALRDAQSMFYNAKEVVNGDYAILDLGDLDYKYYIRENDKWKLDKTLDGKSIDEINFCNLKDNCIKIKKQCVNFDDSKKMLKDGLIKEVLEKMESQIKIGLSDLRSEIRSNLERYKNNLQNLKNLKTKEIIKKDILYNKIANTLDVEEFKTSPYANLRDIILSNSDMVTKFNNVERFIEKFCRDYDISNENESPFWFYCVDTSTKLMPTFYHTLAEAFKNNTYQEVLELICKERGELSDDNDKWIDKHSGYIIKFIEFDDSEGYDESGYKIVSREIMTEAIDVGSFKFTKIKDNSFDYKTELANTIKAMITAFDNNLKINSESEHAFMIKIAIDSMNKNLKTKKQYNELAEKKKKKGKKVKPYEKKHDEVLLKSVSAAYVIGVQSCVPNIVSDITFSICIKSFSGFPLNGNSDISFLNYFNCMLIHLRRGKDRPWSSLPKANRGNFQTKIDELNESLKKFMQEKILTYDYVEEKLQQKRLWNMENNEEEFIPDAFDVTNWSEYLPSLIDVKVNDLQKIGDGFFDLITNDINEGNPEQFLKLWSVYGNIVKSSYSIVESVQKAINDEPLILNTMSNIPFLENACCIEGDPSTYYYFTNKENSIIKFNDRVREASFIYNTYQNLLKPSLFNIDKDTKSVFQKISSDFNENVVYLSFIKYGKFNTGVVLDEELQRLVIKNKSEFKNIDSLERKIDIMKSEGLNYSQDSLKMLINYISKKNIIPINLDPTIVTEKFMLEQVSEYLSSKEIIYLQHQEIITMLSNIVDRFNINYEMKEDELSFIDRFNSRIKSWNSEMSVLITEKMLEHGELKRNHKDLIIKYSSDKSNKKTQKRSERFILNWKEIGEEINMYKDDETGYITFNMLKNLSIDIINIFPNIILNKVNKEKKVPSHWKLSQRHVKDIEKIMTREYEYFTKYYGNKKLNAVLNFVLENNKDLMMLIQTIPFYAKIISEKKIGSIFDGEMIKNLGLYIFLSALMLFINSFDHELSFEQEEPNTNLGELTAKEESIDRSILRGQQEELEKITCNLLSNILKLTESYKKLLNITPEEVTKNVLKSKEKEKAKITVRLRDLADEERKVENIMKNHSLGDWSVGQTRAIYEYDEDQYDKEREELERTALMELKRGVRDEVTEFSSEIYGLTMIDSDNLDYMEEEAMKQRIEGQVYNLEAIPEEDNDDREEIDYM